ncbi:MAG: tRNA glutamyl-Q(34) synthetase GluQRS [Candidatus Thiodiazotropha sp.]
MKEIAYRGRFAPSPTGLLHFGSLVAALGSYLDARSLGGEWLIRIEDVDRLRVVAGAADEMLRTLERFGFEWDGEVIYQSRRSEAYEASIQELIQAGHAYPCSCSRKTIREQAANGPEGPIYPGICRQGMRQPGRANSIRLVTQDRPMDFTDRLLGPYAQNLGWEVGDFVIRRADGFYAYQLAVVVDDAWQGVTHVVRGADLLSSTPRQCYLQELLRLSHPEYLHLPLAIDRLGRKLSKQDQDLPVDPKQPMPSLLAALGFLGQTLPEEPPQRVEEFWQWAIAHWRVRDIPTQVSRPLADARALINLRNPPQADSAIGDNIK